MREFKFRTWDKEEKHFWYFTLQEILERRMNYRGSWDEKVLKGEKTQYTGLEDSNGKEIYDGDIIRGYWHERINDYDTKLYSDIAKVYWDEDNGQWSVIEWTTTDERYPLYDYCEEVVIIGNIFENIKKS